MDSAKTQTTSMRQRLFEPGKYLSLPDVILRRVDLAPSSKLVWMVLAGHLFARGIGEWPSVGDLSDRTGLNARTVIRSIAALSGAGLLAVAKTDGRKSVYRIFQPHAGGGAPRVEVTAGWCQKVTGDKKSLVTESHGTGDKKSLPAFKINPSTGVNPSGRTNSTTTPANDAGVRVQGVEDAVNAAHQAVFGAPMSRTWRARLAAMDGSAVIFATTTEADMRAALDKCQTLKRAWGFGWLEGIMAEKAAKHRAPSRQQAAASTIDLEAMQREGQKRVMEIAARNATTARNERAQR